jgi:hypothetical protein
MNNNSIFSTPYHDPATGNYNFAHEHYHKREMEMICEKKIREIVPKMVQQYTRQAIQQIVGIMEHDIQTCLSMSLNDAGDIFYGDKARQYLSDHITRELQRIVDETDWTINL